ncbi:DNA polymerase III, delta prime subunit [Alteracholeplasma palmae J233]|uniref:DNA polymerase III, delta prime subunit n=1 Tax=Alteracholeplasma palmae (strain ATCC 49389 / J233) TaxID=1318466 RepID=U4KLT5_ALTPJ|nr:DNA polymerase III, delta prime subunit [Alteracholeplasma palmae]CCV64888.1 DNA polymerase III, delta prime subunit [Alteracholeplasma palmae J233]
MKKTLEWFKKAISNNRLSHLYMLSGGTNLGKKELALEIAYEIFKNYKDHPKLKELVETFNYANLIYLEKEGNSIKKEQISFLQDEFNKTSLIGGPRVYIIEDIETLTISAANSLLKFMEEPKGTETIGILLTSQKEQVLPTIISRSQVILLNEQTENEIVNDLIENQILEEDAYLLSVITKDVKDALELLEDPNYLSVKETFLKLTRNWQKTSETLRILLGLPTFLWEDKKWFELFLEILIKYFLDIIHIHMHQEVYFKKDDTLSVNSTKLNVIQCQNMISDIQDKIKEQRYYINLELAFSSLITKLEKRRPRK